MSRHRAAFFGLAAAIVVADQLSKAWIVAGFPFGEPVEVIGAWVRIWFVANNGALFGLFRDQAIVFAALSVAVMALIVWYHGRAVAGSGWLATLALGFGGPLALLGLTAVLPGGRGEAGAGCRSCGSSSGPAGLAGRTGSPPISPGSLEAASSASWRRGASPPTGSP